MADTQAKKLELWASSGDREDPEDVGLTRADGWTVAYEQIGSGSEPERAVFNQLFRELSGWAIDRLRQGIPSWDIEVDYIHPAFTTTASGVWVSTADSGPGSGNATDPDDSGQTLWRRY